MATRGSYVYNSLMKFSGASRKCKSYVIFSKYSWFQTKQVTGNLSSVGWQDLVTQFLVKITFLYKLVAKKLDFVLSKW